MATQRSQSHFLCIRFEVSVDKILNILEQVRVPPLEHVILQA